MLTLVIVLYVLGWLLTVAAVFIAAAVTTRAVASIERDRAAVLAQLRADIDAAASDEDRERIAAEKFDPPARAPRSTGLRDGSGQRCAGVAVHDAPRGSSERPQRNRRPRRRRCIDGRERVVPVRVGLAGLALRRLDVGGRQYAAVTRQT